MRFDVFSYNRCSGAVLSEEYIDGSFLFRYKDDERDLTFISYSDNPPPQTKRNPLYLGKTLEEIMDSPTDILGDTILKGTDPDISDLYGVMPEITDNAYCFLSGAASHGGVTVDTYGLIYPQASGRDDAPKPLFSPAVADPTLEGIKPMQVFLEKRYPILFNVYTAGEQVTELMYFVDSGDSDRDPVVWVREKKYQKNSKESFTLRHGTKEFSHGYASKSEDIFIVDPSLFYDTLAHTLAHWIDFTEGAIRLDLPQKELVYVTEGAMISAQSTFTGAAPHYGHKYYGKELHDNFPPNYIFTIEAACITGHFDWAREIFRYLINYGTTDEGKFCYRQGPFLAGASAVEYAMILRLAEHYKDILLPDGVNAAQRKKLCGMGNIILTHFISCPEFGGMKLIKMCAEADNNVRVNVYLNNNLWAVRGLRALSDLLYSESNIYSDSADILWQNINLLIDQYAEDNKDFGRTVPFRFGYPAVPYTLSNCKTPYLPEEEALRTKYFALKEGRRDFDVTDQEITENTYANYRYYPEILSSMLLPNSLTDPLFKMRKELGGNLLGMTRFRSWLDDWPAVNYARFLIETGRAEEFLLLLYSHTLHHGHPTLACYYEQIKLDGRVSAPDCVPSLLTTPIMTVWSLAYERLEDKKLILLSAFPKKNYSLPFSAKGLGYSKGTLDIVSDGRAITLSFSDGAPRNCEIVFRNFDGLTEENIKCGREFVENIRKNALVIKEGVKEARFILE